VPLKDMDFVVKLKKPDAIFTHLTSVANHFNFEKFLNNMQARVAETPLVISGQITQTYKKKAPQNTQFKKTLSEVMEYIGLIA
jgi:MerR family transcriptional regulator, light-induced transcriptional regulator